MPYYAGTSAPGGGQASILAAAKAKADAAAQVAAQTPTAPAGVPRWMVFGGLAVAGILLYRHFRKGH